jgi:hypothetical protein
MNKQILEKPMPVTPSKKGVNRYHKRCKPCHLVCRKKGLQVYTFRYKVYTPSEVGVNRPFALVFKCLGLSGLHVYTTFPRVYTKNKKVRWRPI